MSKGFLLFLVSFLLSGCANGFSKYYNGATAEQIRAVPGATPCQTPVVAALPGDDAGEIKRKLFEEGYNVIGYSHFTSGMGENSDHALAQGKKLGACLVLYGARHSHTSSGAVPIITPTTSTTTHSGSISGAGAPIGYSGTSTTYGSTTTMMPYSVNVYEYLAVYAVKTRPGPVGVLLEEIPDDVKRRLDSRQGALVTAVRRDGNAYRANIFAGDILLTLNDEPISATGPAPAFRQGSNTLRVLREDKILSKEIEIQ